MDTRILDALDKELQISVKRLAPSIKKLTKAASTEQKRIEKRLGVTATKWVDVKKSAYQGTSQGKMVNYSIREMVLSRLWGELVFQYLYDLKEPRK